MSTRHFPGSLVVLTVLWSTAVASSACAAAGDAECRRALDAAPLEAGVGFGGLRIGMSRAEVEEWIGPAERTMGDGWEYLTCGFAVVFGSDGKIGALLAGGHPELNDLFTLRSEEGLGIGSTRQEVVGVFGEPSEIRSDGQMLHYYPEGIVWTVTDGRVSHLTIRRPRPDLDR